MQLQQYALIFSLAPIFLLLPERPAIAMIVKASNGGSGNKVKNNLGVSGGSIRYSCHVQVEGNQGFKIKPCWQDK